MQALQQLFIWVVFKSVWIFLHLPLLLLKIDLSYFSHGTSSGICFILWWTWWFDTVAVFVWLSWGFSLHTIDRLWLSPSLDQNHESFFLYPSTGVMWCVCICFCPFFMSIVKQTSHRLWVVCLLHRVGNLFYWLLKMFVWF